MNTARIGLLGVLLTTSLAAAQGVILPNPSFEDGTDRPAGWTLVGKPGAWLSEGAAEGKRAIAVTGDGAGDSYWRSEPIGLMPATVYRLTFRARSMDMQGGTPVTGPMFCNRDLGQIAQEWRTYESIFTTGDVVNSGQAMLRFGQWQVRGTILFDSIALRQAMPVYARRGEMALGEGERITGNDYAFEAPFSNESRNHSRALAGYTCTFNTDRWVLSAGTQVVYRHEVAGRQQASGQVRVSVNWYASGELAVEASADGKSWQSLGVMGKQAEQVFEIPAGMLPAERIWVRLEARPSRSGGDASLQVGGYGYKAVLAGQPLTFIGATRFLAVGATDKRLAVTIEDLGEALPGGKNILVAKVNNTSGQRIRAEPTVTVQREGAKATTKAPAVLEPGEMFLEMPYEIAGAGVSTIQYSLGAGIAFQAEASVRVAELYGTGYGQLLPGSGAQADLWWASSGWKISRTRPAPRAAGEAVMIRAAANEAEAAQVVIRPKRPMRNFTAKAESLAGPNGAVIGAGNVEILRARYVMVARPTDGTGAVASWPDPLPALSRPIDLDAEANQPLWVRVSVPKDARPGTYVGKIRLSAMGYSGEVAVKVEVYGFALPDRMTCQTAFGFSPGEVWRYQKLDKEADRRAVLEKYLASFSAHHISPYDPAPLDRIRVTWPDRKTLVPAVDFTAWDAAMKRAMEQYHFNSFMVDIPGMGGGSFHARVEPELLGYREGQAEYRTAFRNYCKAMESHLLEKGWLNEAYVYWFDEPDPKDYEFVMNGFRKLKEAAPGLKGMLTEQVEPGLVGGPTIWCPITPEYKHEAAEERRKAGERFWWYVCTGPKAPYCTLFLDHPATELRVWLWQTWQRQITGILVWQTNYWTSETAYTDPKRPQNPYEDPMSWTSGYGMPKGTKNPWGNGDGRFIYPPEAAADARSAEPVLDGPVESIRWEMLRDGIEDYEYLCILRGLLEQKGGKLTAEQRAASAALLEVPKEITKDMTTFTTDPGPIEARRDAVAKAIEQLSRL